MPNQQMMMQGQAQGSGAPATMPGNGPSGNMGKNGGCPMGMMGGGMGPGMMSGGMGQGYGMGPGMMGGMGGPGNGMMMGSGMMGGGMGQGYGMEHGGWAGRMGPMAMLDLSDAQTAQLEKIQTELRKTQRALMRQMWDEQEKMSDLFDVEKRDPVAIGKAFSKLADLQRHAMEARIDAENKAATVLTKEQKAKMRRGFGSGMMGY
ncbi:Spy/CpxP family protein refolding chaperone [Sulfuricella denitrificans]|nr:Spy/CpxP family protein refolding chaperone [Sulfuricella denitrificans]